MSRWDALTPEERHLLHHALRFLLARLDSDSDDAVEALRLADEIWADHCARVDELRSRAVFGGRV